MTKAEPFHRLNQHFLAGRENGEERRRLRTKEEFDVG